MVVSKIPPVITLFDNVQIRDTSAHAPRALVDIRDAATSAFEIFNGTDKTVTLDLVGSLYDDPGGAGTLGASVTVATGVRTGWLVQPKIAFIGVRVTFTVAPTVGQITITGQAQKLG